MDLNVYQRKATGTFKPAKELESHEARLCDWGLGLAGESGEIAELIKHYVFHKETFDVMRLAKEIGDVLWYLSAMCETVRINLSDCAELNIEKLAHRHDGANYSSKGSGDRSKREENFKDTEIYKELERRINHGLRR